MLSYYRISVFLKYEVIMKFSIHVLSLFTLLVAFASPVFASQKLLETAKKVESKKLAEITDTIEIKISDEDKLQHQRLSELKLANEEIELRTKENIDKEYSELEKFALRLGVDLDEPMVTGIRKEMNRFPDVLRRVIIEYCSKPDYALLKGWRCCTEISDQIYNLDQCSMQCDGINCKFLVNGLRIRHHNYVVTSKCNCSADAKLGAYERAHKWRDGSSFVMDENEIPIRISNNNFVCTIVKERNGCDFWLYVDKAKILKAVLTPKPVMHRDSLSCWERNIRPLYCCRSKSFIIAVCVGLALGLYIIGTLTCPESTSCSS